MACDVSHVHRSGETLAAVAFDPPEQIRAVMRLGYSSYDPKVRSQRGRGHQQAEQFEKNSLRQYAESGPSLADGWLIAGTKKR